MAKAKKKECIFCEYENEVSGYHVFLPYPDRRLSPNNRTWGSVKFLGGIQEKAKSDAFKLSKHLKGVTVERGVRITFYVPDNRRRDLDNLLASMKHALDGVAVAMEVDDSTFRPLIIDKVKAKSKADIGVLVEIL